MAQASQFLIAGNDEHGMNPPTAGKRTPIMPYIDRPFFENEFNRPAKQRFLGVCARIGFNTFDVHPEVTDTSVSTRVTRTNRAGVSCVITFAYNATVNENFNSTAGTLIYYSTTNPYRTASRTLSGLISESIGAYNAVPELGVRTLDIGMLSSVNRPACLVEAGFMTNFREAKLMMDPQFQQIVAEGTAQAVCAYFGVTYLPLQPASAYSLLRRGSRGQQVLYLQWLLTVYGYQPGSPDGIFGSGTQAAVQAFQRDNGLSADGPAFDRLCLRSPAPPGQPGHLRPLPPAKTALQAVHRGRGGRHFRTEHPVGGPGLPERKRTDGGRLGRPGHLAGGHRAERRTASALTFPTRLPFSEGSTPRQNGLATGEGRTSSGRRKKSKKPLDAGRKRTPVWHGSRSEASGPISAPNEPSPELPQTFYAPIFSVPNARVLCGLRRVL